MSVLIAAQCSKCKTKYPEMWVSRDSKGFPTTEGLKCSLCNETNYIVRDWGDNHSAGHMSLDDGQVHRIEYEYKDKNGKKHQGKVR